MKQRYSFIILLLWIVTPAVHAQTIDFNYTNGSSVSYNVTDVRKITFIADIMNLHFLDGSVFSWDVNTIDYYTYNETPLKVENYLNALNDFKFNVFPNPTNDFLTLSFNLPFSDQLKISIYDHQGKIILEKNLGNLTAGFYTESIDMSKLESNSYVFKFFGSKFSFTKTIIKNN